MSIIKSILYIYIYICVYIYRLYTLSIVFEIQAEIRSRVPQNVISCTLSALKTRKTVMGEDLQTQTQRRLHGAISESCPH
jgi:hypothetical protein